MTITNSFAINIRANKDNPLVDVVADHFDGLRKRSDEDIEPLEYYKQNLFFVTVTFIPNTVSLHESQIIKNGLAVGVRTSALNEFGKSFLRINKHLLGSNLSRKKHLQPHAWMFVDYELTRHGSGSEKKNLHLHGVLLVNPRTREKFLQIAETANLHKTLNMQSLVIEPFDPSRVKPSLNGAYENDPLKRCISYASKGCRKHWSDDDGAHWNVFPKFR